MRASRRRQHLKRICSLQGRSNKQAEVEAQEAQQQALYIKPIINPAPSIATKIGSTVGEKRAREDSEDKELDEEDNLELVMQEDDDDDDDDNDDEDDPDYVQQEADNARGGVSLLQRGCTIVAQNNFQKDTHSAEEHPILVYENVFGSKVWKTSVVKSQYMSVKVEPSDDYTVDQLLGLNFEGGQIICGFLPIMCATPQFKLTKSGQIQGSVFIQGWLNVQKDKVYFVGLQGQLMSTSRNQFSALGGKASCNASKRTIYSNFEKGKNYRLEVCEKIFHFNLSNKKHSVYRRNISPSLHNPLLRHDEFINAQVDNNVITTYQNVYSAQNVGITGENNPQEKPADQLANEVLDVIKDIQNFINVDNAGNVNLSQNIETDAEKMSDEQAAQVMDVMKDTENVVNVGNAENTEVLQNVQNVSQSGSQVDVHADDVQNVQNVSQSGSQVDVHADDVQNVQNVSQRGSQVDVHADDVQNVQNVTQSGSQVDVHADDVQNVQNVGENQSSENQAGEETGQNLGTHTEAAEKPVKNNSTENQENLEQKNNGKTRQKLIQEQQQNLLEHQRRQLFQQQQQLQQQFQIYYSSLFTQQMQSNNGTPPVLNLSNPPPEFAPHNNRPNLNKKTKQQEQQIEQVRKHYSKKYKQNKEKKQSQKKQAKQFPTNVIPEQLFFLPQVSGSAKDVTAAASAQLPSPPTKLVTTGQLPPFNQQLPQLCMHLPQIHVKQENNTQNFENIQGKQNQNQIQGKQNQIQEVIVISDDSDKEGGEKTDDKQQQQQQQQQQQSSKTRIVSINYMYSQIQKSDQATKSTDSNVNCELTQDQISEIQNMMNSEKQSNENEDDQNNKLARSLHEKFDEAVKPVVWCDMHNEHRWFLNDDGCFYCPKCVFGSMQSQKKAQNQDFENKNLIKRIEETKLKVYNNEQLVMYYLQQMEEGNKQMRIFEEQMRQLQVFVNGYHQGIQDFMSRKDQAQREINETIASQKELYLKYSQGTKKIVELEKQAIELQKQSTKSFNF